MRELQLGKGTYIIPLSLAVRAEREVDFSDATFVCVYPDDTKGSELDEIIRAARDLQPETKT